MFKSMKQRWRKFNYSKSYYKIDILEAFAGIVSSYDGNNYIESYKPNKGFSIPLRVTSKSIDELQLSMQAVTQRLINDGIIGYKFDDDTINISLEDYLRTENGRRVLMESGMNAIAVRATTLAFAVKKVTDGGIPESTIQRKLTPVIRDVTELAKVILGD